MRMSAKHARRRLPQLVVVAVGVIVVLVHLVALAASLEGLATWTKPLLMPIVGLWVACEPRRGARLPRVLLGAGIVLSWLGDVLIGPSLLVGLVMFLAAHVAYVAAFLRLGHGRPPWWCVLLAAWYGWLLWLVAPSAGTMLVPLAVYGLALAALAIAASRVSPLAAVGAVLFVASDSMLGIRLFTEHLGGAGFDVLVMGTYVAAQACIAVAVARRA